jgi:hypothetical protein
MQIKNWAKFQHFKDGSRKPPWIKLYRDLLDNLEWHELPPESAKVLIMLWVVASENHGKLPDIKKLSFRLRVTEDQLMKALNDLKEWVLLDDITTISEGYQGTRLEEKRKEIEEEREIETEHDIITMISPLGVTIDKKETLTPEGELALEWMHHLKRRKGRAPGDNHADVMIFFSELLRQGHSKASLIALIADPARDRTEYLFEFKKALKGDPVRPNAKSVGDLGKEVKGWELIAGKGARS